MRLKKSFLLFPLTVVYAAAGTPMFKDVHLLIQARYDYGDLLYDGGNFHKKGDFYIRRFRFILKKKLSKYFSVKLNLAADRWFQDYKKGKEEQTPKRVVFKELYIEWKPSKNFYISIGRNKKPITRAGLNPSKDLLLIDKPQLYLELKKFLGDYYANQVETGGFLLGGVLRYRIATAYAYPFHKYNGLSKTSVHLRENFFNNYFVRLEFSPPGWVEKNTNNTTFGKRALSFGLSYGYLGKFSVYRGENLEKAAGYLDGFDFFVRKPKLLNGSWVFLYEYLRGKYTIAKGDNISKDGFYFRLGYRPYLHLKFPLEMGAGFEDINSHPGAKREYIYESCLNLYSPSGRFKFTLDFSIARNIRTYSDKSAFLMGSQIQFYF